MLEHIAGFDLLLRRLAALASSPIPQFEWDVFLSNVNGYKAEVIDDDSRSAGQRRALLEAPMPKFMWRAVATLPGGAKAIEVLFDATGIELGEYCFRVAEIDPRAGDLFRSIWGMQSVRGLLRDSQAWQIISHLVPST